MSPLVIKVPDQKPKAIQTNRATISVVLYGVPCKLEATDVHLDLHEDGTLELTGRVEVTPKVETKDGE